MGYKAYFEGADELYGDVMGVRDLDGDAWYRVYFDYADRFDIDELLPFEEIREAVNERLAEEDEPSMDADARSYYDLEDDEKKVFLSVASEHLGYSLDSVEAFGMSTDEEVEILKKELIELIREEDDECDMEEIMEALESVW